MAEKEFEFRMDANIYNGYLDNGIIMQKNMACFDCAQGISDAVLKSNFPVKDAGEYTIEVDFVVCSS